jgi:PPK2 family polyphosphate:nucleotide phosphotransferase
MRSLLNAAAGFSLSSIDPRSTPGFAGGKHDGRAALAARAAELSELQEKLFASAAHGGSASVLLVVQAMDTAGKGGIVRHVLGEVNPQGVQAFSFKAPTEEEKQHDFLWRIRKRLPTAGHIGVFDRSHYEDVLIHRVRGFSPPDVIEERYGLINEFEAEVVATGTTIVKVMLHISADEQKERLGDRLSNPDKHWKYNPSDVDERGHWPAYMEAYNIAIERTSTPIAPWYVVPADHKWFARLAVQGLLLDALRGLDLAWPPADFDVAIEKVRLAES